MQKQLNGLPWRLYSPSLNDFARHGNSYQILAFFTESGAKAACELPSWFNIDGSSTWEDYYPVNVESWRWKLREWWWRFRWFYHHNLLTMFPVTASWACSRAVGFPDGSTPKESAIGEIECYENDGEPDANHGGMFW